MCGGGALLELDSCGAAEAADTLLTCIVTVSTLVLPKAADLHVQEAGLLDKRLAKAKRAAISTAFDGVAELVCLPRHAFACAHGMRNQETSQDCNCTGCAASDCSDYCLQMLVVDHQATSPASSGDEPFTALPK
jgi:hypothetical protein